MSSFQLPKVTVLNDNGVPISGALLHFYTTGTTTETNTYTDEALTTPHANPVVCDSSGRAGPIYFDTDTTYKCVVADASDTTVYTVDPVPQPGGAGLSLRVDQIASSPLDYGAIGDGVSDESSEVQDAIDGSTGTVDLLGKTFRCDSRIQMKAGMRLINGTLDFSNDTSDTECIYFSGGFVTGNALTSDAIVGDTVVSVTSTGGMSVGDFVRITATSATWETAEDAVPGEWNQFISPSGLDLTLAGPLHNDYTVANGASLDYISTDTRVTMDGVKIIGATQGGVNQRGLLLSRCNGATVNNCEFENIDDYCVSVEESVNFKITNCRLIGIHSTLGVNVRNGCAYGEVSGLTTHGVNTGVSVAGFVSGTTDNVTTQFITVSGCDIQGSNTDGITVGSGAHMCKILDNNIVCDKSTGDGIYCRGSDISIRGNHIKFGYNGIEVRPDRETRYAFTDLLLNGADQTSYDICDNIIEFTTKYGIYLDTADSTDTVEGVRISNNSVYGSASFGIFVTAQTQNLSDVSIDSNHIQAAEGDSIYVFAVGSATITGVNVRDNHIKGVGSGISDGVYLNSAEASGISNAIVSGNLIENPWIGVQVDDASVVSITDNVINSASKGIQYNATTATGTACKDICISGNRTSDDTGPAIEIDIDELSLTNVIISDNICTCPSSSVNVIDIDVASTKKLLCLGIHNNIVDITDYQQIGISVIANSFDDSPTADDEGIFHSSISGNIIRSKADGSDVGPEFGLSMKYCQNVSVTNNTFDGDGCIEMEDCEWVTITGNMLTSEEGMCIYFLANTAINGLTISGNTCYNYNTLGVSGACIAVLQHGNAVLENVSINGNSVYVGANGWAGITCSATDATLATMRTMSIVGNTIYMAHNGTTVGGITFQSAVNGTFKNVIVSGNVVNRTSSTAGTGCLYVNHGASGTMTLENYMITGNTFVGADHSVRTVSAGGSLTTTDAVCVANLCADYAGTVFDTAGGALDFEVTSTIADAVTNTRLPNITP